MKMFLPLLCFLTYVFAEPPVGDSYASALSHNQEQGYDLQRSVSEEYGPPTNFGARNLPTQYGPPRARTNRPSQSHAASRLSQEYGVPSARSPSQQYGPPSARLSQSYGVPSTRNNPSQQYGVPSARNNPQEYLPSVKKTDFSVPRSRTSLSARTPSSLYGAPELRSKPSEEYGVPPQSSGKHSSFRSQFSTQTPLEQYGVPSGRSNDIGQGYPAARNFKSSAKISQSYGVPKSQDQSFGSQPLSSYGVPAARDADSYSQGFNALSESYGAPSQRDLSDAYGVPDARSLSQQYGVPATRSNLKTKALVSSYANSRSAPSSTYGAPSARDAMPSDQYGVPDQYSNLSNQGDEYAKGALDELLNQEPANYDFAYKVNDFESGSDFGHTESRQENKAEGTYFVVLPDGTKQTVEYEADERGFKPRISVEPADLARSGGYDDNASDLTRSGDGPY